MALAYQSGANTSVSAIFATSSTLLQLNKNKPSSLPFYTTLPAGT